MTDMGHVKNTREAHDTSEGEGLRGGALWGWGPVGMGPIGGGTKGGGA